MKILLLGNCQCHIAHQILLAQGRHQVELHFLQQIPPRLLDQAHLRSFDLILAQDIRSDFGVLWDAIGQHPNVAHLPFLNFVGFTPDEIGIAANPAAGILDLDHISWIMTAAWKRGLDPQQTKKLFNPDFIQLMGFYRLFATRREMFISGLKAYTPRAEHLFSKWFSKEPFFYSSGHPKSFIIEDMVREVLRGRDVALPAEGVSAFLLSPFAKLPILPHLNHPAATNRLDRVDHLYMRDGRVMPLDEMIPHTYGRLNKAAESVHFSSHFPDRILPSFDAAYRAWAGREPEPMSNPYGPRPRHNFWSRAIARLAPADVPFGASLRPVIGHTTRVATAGSCFAQHVARAMVADGLNYYIVEGAPDGMPEEQVHKLGYGLFSARYGNIYSTRQLVQLIRRAYGKYTPIETAWQVEGGFIDPFRPNIGETFESVPALEAARAEHLAHVRTMFETLDVFVFTLGLTEGWIDRRDGAAFPVTPGAVTKHSDPSHFAFLNLDHAAVKADLVDFLNELSVVNPEAQVVLTVSPVPLIATYCDDDVLTATTYSKSTLRAAVGDIARIYEHVQYFPSYEIITGSFNRGAYFEDDFRGIRPEGVAHVMRVFRDRLVSRKTAVSAPPHPSSPPEATASVDEREGMAKELARQANVICDEELLITGI